MRVEFVSPYDHSPKTGIGRYLHSLVHYLSESIEVAIHQPLFLPLAERFSPLKTLPIGIKDHLPDSIVHFPQIMGCAMMLYRPYHPSVASVHDLGVLELPEEWAMFDPIARQMLRLSLAGLRRVDHFIVHSSHTRDGLIKHLEIPKQRITIVPTWIDSDFFRPVDGSRQMLAGSCDIDLDDGVFNLAYIGSELPRKNLSLLLEAMAILKAKGYRTRLVKIGGAGGDRWRTRTLQDVERLGLSDDIVFTGVVSDEDVILFLNAADLCVTPTLLESTFAWVALGAMACGRPSVVTSSALVPEEAQDAVLVVPPRDLEMLIQAIEQCILDADLRQKMGEAGRRIIRSYRGEATAETIIGALRSLLE